MTDRTIRFGIIGLGLMGKEFASAVARWCHFRDDISPRPVITGICDKSNPDSRSWFLRNFNKIVVDSTDYNDLLASSDVDAIYCAVPHNLHQKLYTDIIRSGKHLLGEKPFGIDLTANQKILEEIDKRPDLIVRCSSEFPYFPGARRVIEFIKSGAYGQLMEVRCGFHHSSDMDLLKPINWKRTIEINGEYGCMGDLILHTLHIPLRMGWFPKWIFADLQKIVETRPDGKGNPVPCETWDNAVITSHCTDPRSNKEFSLVLETKRMAPGQTNTWFIEVYGTKGSVRFSTHDPKAFYFLETSGNEQGWTRLDIGYQSFLPTLTGGIFEFGFSDAILQMIGAFISDFNNESKPHPFQTVFPGETNLSHRIMDAAVRSFKTGMRINT
jgi:predicted dehydrogenase